MTKPMQIDTTELEAYAKTVKYSVDDQRQLLNRVRNYIDNVSAGSSQARILSDCFNKNDSAEFGLYFLKYMDEFEAEQSREREQKLQDEKNIINGEPSIWELKQCD